MGENTSGKQAIQFEENEAKFVELLLYIIAKSSDDHNFGSTKLNKLLFACDLFAYGIFGQPLTGFRYAKRQFGPAPRRFAPVRDELIEQRALAMQERPRGQYTQKRPIALRPPDISQFSPDEIALIDDVLATFRGANAAEISEWSHGLCGWAIAEDDADIPYEAVFISDAPMTAYEAERGRHLALERDWDVF